MGLTSTPKKGTKVEMLRIEISRSAQKDLKKVPREILLSFYAWVDRLDKIGIDETKKIKGYNDEALRGKRKGQRSVRLNKAYRAIYTIDKTGEIKILEVLEVSKHKY